MAINAKQGQEMVDACKKANVKLLVGYRMHFEPKTLKLSALRKDGEFGKILFFQGLSGVTNRRPNTMALINKELAGGRCDDGHRHFIRSNGSRYMIGE
jgi:predicted dehydrogenase